MTRFVAFALALLGPPVTVLAQGGDPGDGPHASVRLIAETKSVAPGQKLHVLLVQKIQSGWHTYWVNPGDSGLPTTIDWSLPAGLTASPIAWPCASKAQIFFSTFERPSVRVLDAE